MTVEKPTPKQLLRPITTGTNSAMNQSEFLAIRCNLLKARKKWREQGAIGFGFAPHWLKYWREIFKPIAKCSNRNRVLTFDSHLKTALLERFSNDCRKTKTKVITLTNHNRSEERDEPIRIPSNYL